jgi:glutathione S-transferase
MKLYYFDIYGKGEPARILLHTVKVEFEDVRYSFEDWGATHKHSGKFEFEQLPDLELDGHTYAQSQSILRLLGKKYGYYPEDALTGWKVDSILDANADITSASYKYLLENDAEKKKAALEHFAKEVFPKFAAILEKRVAANSNHHHIVGDSLTIADFALGA